jgi:hypothetical protein
VFRVINTSILSRFFAAYLSSSLNTKEPRLAERTCSDVPLFDGIQQIGSDLLSSATHLMQATLYGVVGCHAAGPRHLHDPSHHVLNGV